MTAEELKALGVTFDDEAPKKQPEKVADVMNDPAWKALPDAEKRANLLQRVDAKWEPTIGGADVLQRRDKQTPIESALHGVSAGGAQGWGPQLSAAVDTAVAGPVVGKAIEAIGGHDPRLPSLADSSVPFSARADAYRDLNAGAAEDNPKAFGLSKLASGVATAGRILPAPAGAWGAAGMGAAVGGVNAAGESRATGGDYVRDIARGATSGAALGAGTYGLGKYALGAVARNQEAPIRSLVQRGGAKQLEEAGMQVDRGAMIPTLKDHPEVRGAIGTPEAAKAAETARGPYTESSAKIYGAADAAHGAKLSAASGVPDAGGGGLHAVEVSKVFDDLAAKVSGKPEAKVLEQLKAQFNAELPRLGRGRDRVNAAEVRKWITEELAPAKMQTSTYDDSVRELAKASARSGLRDRLHQYVGEHVGPEAVRQLEINNDRSSALSTIQKISEGAALKGRFKPTATSAPAFKVPKLAAVTQKAKDVGDKALATPPVQLAAHVATDAAGAAGATTQHPVERLKDVLRAAPAGAHAAKVLKDFVFGTPVAPQDE